MSTKRGQPHTRSVVIGRPVGEGDRCGCHLRQSVADMLDHFQAAPSAASGCLEQLEVVQILAGVEETHELSEKQLTSLLKT